MERELIPQNIEEFTKAAVFKDLVLGDPLWDVPHARAVVHHAKLILRDEPGVDGAVVIIAAYGHDWGYSAYYRPGQAMPKAEYMEAKKTHAQIAADKMRELLRNEVYSPLSEEQKERIIYLILNHDSLAEMKDKDEQILMEADTLGGLDTDFVTSTWTKEQDLKHMQDVKNKRFPLFVTETGKRAFEVCFQKRLNAIDTLHPD